MKRDTHLNIIGPEIRRIRKQRGWSQSKLALHLQSVGWNISRSGLDSGLAVHQSRPLQCAWRNGMGACAGYQTNTGSLKHPK